MALANLISSGNKQLFAKHEIWWVLLMNDVKNSQIINVFFIKDTTKYFLMRTPIYIALYIVYMSHT